MNLINLDHLRNKKNLLAFSGGTDSSALFHLLIKESISFDIAIVNYNTRETSVNETEYALKLAEEYNLTCYTKSVNIVSTSNFEMNARNIRYVFFNSLILEHSYDNLITGHNLNDKMEWFLMQMTKGAGIKELFGMEPVSTKDLLDTGRTYDIIRPLLSTSKDKILFYLKEKNIEHFFDESNKDEKYKRNYFRKHYVESLVSDFSIGIKRTFEILEEEVKSFNVDLVMIEAHTYIATDLNFVLVADKLLKKNGYVMSGFERAILKDKKELVYRKYNKAYVLSYVDGKIYFTPFLKDIVVPKDFRDSMRIQRIPSKHRAYYFSLSNPDPSASSTLSC